MKAGDLVVLLLQAFIIVCGIMSATFIIASFLCCLESLFSKEAKERRRTNRILKTLPSCHCSARPTIILHNDCAWISCRNCGIETLICKDLDTAIKSWNKMQSFKYGELVRDKIFGITGNIVSFDHFGVTIQPVNHDNDFISVKTIPYYRLEKVRTSARLA